MTLHNHRLATLSPKQRFLYLAVVKEPDGKRLKFREEKKIDWAFVLFWSAYLGWFVYFLVVPTLVQRGWL